VPTPPRIDWDYWKGFGQGFLDEFGKDGCARLFFGATLDALNPISDGTPSLADGGEVAASAATAIKVNNMLAYAASRPNYLGGQGLIYPMKSSVYRTMLADVKTTAASGVVWSVDLAELQGLIVEGKAMVQGQCR